MKPIGKYIFKGIGFIGIFLILFYIVTVTLRFKDSIGIRQMEDFYRYDAGSFDVISIGSSRVGVNLDPEILLQEYGIKEYNLWGSMQPAWNSYYYLKEALKTQTPELICVETAIMTQDSEYSEYARVINNTMGMKLTRDKIEAVQVSIGAELQKEILLEWATYHSRYGDLTKEDFNYYFWKNYEPVDGRIDSGYDSYVVQRPVILAGGDSLPLYEKQEQYLRKIIELCQEKGIALLLFVTPYSATESDQMKYQRIAEIAEEYGEGVTFKNFLEDLDAIPVNFETDYADGGGHFNNAGIEKFTMHFGRYLKEHFTITVRNEEYAGKFNLQKKYACAYRLPEAFLGDAAGAYGETGQTLFDAPNRNWTLFADFDTEIYGEDQVYFSCYGETPGSYRGLLVKREDHTLYIIVGDNYYVETEIPQEGAVRIAVRKTGNVYDVYGNGKLLEGGIVSACSAYDGTLVLGCERDEDLNPYRFSAANIYEMEVYNTLVDEKDILRWLQEERTAAGAPPIRVQASVAYYLEQEFVGNGLDAGLDTGICLYDDPMRNWTLLTELDLQCDKSKSDLVYMSCFDETAGEYRGLILRYKDGKIEAVLGNTYYVDIPDPGKNSIKIAIVKEGSNYKIYADGQELASFSSFCKAYAGNLLLGCQEELGRLIRHSPVTVKRLEIYDEIVPGQEIATW